MFSQTRTRSPKRACQSINFIQPASSSIGGSHTVPVGDVLVGDTGGHVEHDDTALAVDVVPITETTELLLASSVPHVELDLTEVLLWC